MADTRTMPYRPSNGTEGGMFYDQWCAYCKRDEAWRNRIDLAERIVFDKGCWPAGLPEPEDEGEV